MDGSDALNVHAQNHASAHSLAAARGLRVGDFVEGINGEPLAFMAPARRRVIAHSRSLHMEVHVVGRAAQYPMQGQGAVLHGRVSALYASYFQRDPRFDDSHFRAVTGLASHPADTAYLRRLIDFCVDEGFLPTASAMAT